MKAFHVLLACGLALAGCTSQPRLVIVPASSGADANSPVRIALGQTLSVNGASRLPTLLVTVTNTTNTDQTFGPGNVTVSVRGAAIRIYTAAELAADIRKEAEFRRYAAQTRAELQAQAIEQDPTPVANRSAIEIRANGLQESAAASWAERRAIADLGNLLSPTVLKPGETITRVVVLHPEDLRGASAVEVHIRLGNADHPSTLRVVG